MVGPSNPASLPADWLSHAFEYAPGKPLATPGPRQALAVWRQWLSKPRDYTIIALTVPFF